jgi:hypothetical protein
MYSLREMGMALLGAGLFLASAGRVVQMGASWLGLPLRWWQATLSLPVSIGLVSVVVSVVGVWREAAADKREKEVRAQLERRFPGTGATLLSSGSWLLTDIASGRTTREVAPQDFNLSA